MLDDPMIENRAREISSELRCVVCQNQSIDDSDADIARSMRLLVRERLLAGDSDDQVIGYIVARYGDFILLRPPFQANTLALWLTPPIMAIVIAAVALLYCRTYQRRRIKDTRPHRLSLADRRELEALVNRFAAVNLAPSPHNSLSNEIKEGLNPRDPDANTGEGKPNGDGTPRPA